MSISRETDSKDRLLVVGAGGHGLVVADAADSAGRWREIDFVDDRYPDLSKVECWEVVGNTRQLERYSDAYDQAIVAVGASSTRIAIIDRLSKTTIPLATVVHPRACVSRLATVGRGSVILAHAVVNARAAIDEGCIVNTAATVDHDCALAVGVHIGPGANLAADVTVGEHSWIGAGAVVREQIQIGSNVIIGAGAAVVSNVADGEVVAGVPARPLNSREQLKAIGD